MDPIMDPTIMDPTVAAITDFSVELDGVELGVSVTRCMGAPAKPVDAEAAER